MTAIVDPRLGFVCSRCHERHASLCDGCAAPAELTLEEAVDALALARRRESLQEAVALLASRGIVLARRLVLVLAVLAGVAHGQTPTPTATPTATPRYWTGWLPFGANAAVTSGAGDNDGYECYTGACDITCGTPMSTVGTSADGTTCQDRNAGTTNNNTTCNASGRDQHRFSSFGVSIPAGSAVLGVAVKVVAGADSATGDPKLLVNIGDASAPYAGSLCIDSAVLSAGSLTTYTFGNSVQTWNIASTLTEAAVESANFSVYVTNGAVGTARDFYLDYLAIAVYYAPPGPTPPPNGVQWFDGYEAGELTLYSYLGRAAVWPAGTPTPVPLTYGANSSIAIVSSGAPTPAINRVAEGSPTPVPTPAINRHFLRFSAAAGEGAYQTIPIPASNTASASCWVYVATSPGGTRRPEVLRLMGGNTALGVVVIEPAELSTSVWLKAYWGVTAGRECLASGNNYTACTLGLCPLPTPGLSEEEMWASCECLHTGAPGEVECGDSAYAGRRIQTGKWYQVGIAQTNAAGGNAGAVGLTLTVDGRTKGEERSQGTCANGYACASDADCVTYLGEGATCATSNVVQVDAVRIGVSDAGDSAFVIDVDSCVVDTSAPSVLTFPIVQPLYVDKTPAATLNNWVPEPTATPAQSLLADLTAGGNDTNTYVKSSLNTEGYVEVDTVTSPVPTSGSVLGVTASMGLNALSISSGLAWWSGIADGANGERGHYVLASDTDGNSFKQTAYSFYPTRPAAGGAWTQAALDGLKLRADQPAIGPYAQGYVTSLLGQVAATLPTPRPYSVLTNRVTPTPGQTTINVCLWGDSTSDNQDYPDAIDPITFNADSLAWCTSGGKQTQDIHDRSSVMLPIASTVSSDDAFGSWTCREQKAGSLPIGQGCDYVVVMAGYNDFHRMPTQPYDGVCFSDDTAEDGGPCNCDLPTSAARKAADTYSLCYRGANRGDTCDSAGDCSVCVGGANNGLACRPRCTNNAAACGECSGGPYDGKWCATTSQCGSGTCPGCSGGYCNVDYDCPGAGTCQPLAHSVCVGGARPGGACTIAGHCNEPTPTGSPAATPTGTVPTPTPTPKCSGSLRWPWSACGAKHTPVSQNYCTDEACLDVERCRHGVCVQQHNVARSIETFRAILNAIVAYGAKPIAILPPDPDMSTNFGCWRDMAPQLAAFRAWLRTYATDNGLNWIDLAGAFGQAAAVSGTPAPASNYRDGVHFRLGSDGRGQRLMGDLVRQCLSGDPESNTHVHCDDL